MTPEQPQEAKAWWRKYGMLSDNKKRYEWMVNEAGLKAILAESHRRGVDEGRREMAEEIENNARDFSPAIRDSYRSGKEKMAEELALEIKRKYLVEGMLNGRYGHLSVDEFLQDVLSIISSLKSLEK